MDTLDKLLDLVQNADLFTKRVQELKSEQKKLVDMIETYSKVSEVEGKHAAAKLDREEAEAVLAAAKKQAEVIVSQSQTDAAKIVADAEVLKSKAVSVISENELLRTNLERTLSDNGRMRKQINSDMELAAKLKKEVEVELAEVREKSANLRSVLG